MMATMSLRRLVVIAATAAAALLGATACDPPPAPTPTPATLDVVGDSITAQSFWNRDTEWQAAGPGMPTGQDLVVDAWLGYRFEDVQARETARANDPDQPRPAVLVIALGTNNLGDGTWDGVDEVAFAALLHTPSPSSCVVVALPAVGPGAGPVVAERFALARARMTAIAERRPSTVVRDGWAETLAVHPEYVGADGVHLARDHALAGDQANPEAADAYASNLWTGVRSCPAT